MEKTLILKIWKIPIETRLPTHYKPKLFYYLFWENIKQGYEVIPWQVLLLLPTNICFSVSHSGAARTPLATKAKNAFLTCWATVKKKKNKTDQIKHNTSLHDVIVFSGTEASDPLLWSIDGILNSNDSENQHFKQRRSTFTDLNSFKCKHKLLLSVLYLLKLNIFEG